MTTKQDINFFVVPVVVRNLQYAPNSLLIILLFILLLLATSYTGANYCGNGDLIECALYEIGEIRSPLSLHASY